MGKSIDLVKANWKVIIALMIAGLLAIIAAYDMYQNYIHKWDEKSQIDSLLRNDTLQDSRKYEEETPSNLRAINTIGLLDQTVTKWNNKGLADIQQSKYDEAIEAFDKAIQLNPNLAEVWSNRGTALFNQGKFDEAIQAFDKAIQLNPNLAPAWNNKGSALDDIGIWNNDLDEANNAIQAFDKAIQLNPDYREAWYNKGVTLSRIGRTTEANTAFARAKELGYNISFGPLYWLEKGNSLIAKGNFSGAIKAYDEAIRLDPTLAQYPVLLQGAWIYIGYVFSIRGKYDEAIQDFDKAIEFNSSKNATAIAWYLKGIVLGQQGKYVEAIKALEQVTKFKQQYAGAWAARGLALTNRGNYSEAIKACDEAAQFPPLIQEAWISKGYVLSIHGKYKEAIQEFDKAIELNLSRNATATAWYLKGSALDDIGIWNNDLDEANNTIQAFDKAIQLNPDYREAWYNKGVTLSRIGRTTEANTAFARAKELRYKGQ